MNNNNLSHYNTGNETASFDDQGSDQDSNSNLGVDFLGFHVAMRTQRHSCKAIDYPSSSLEQSKWTQLKYQTYTSSRRLSASCQNNHKI